jgi:hypothetical protein
MARRGAAQGRQPIMGGAYHGATALIGIPGEYERALSEVNQMHATIVCKIGIIHNATLRTTTRGDVHVDASRMIEKTTAQIEPKPADRRNNGCAGSSVLLCCLVIGALAPHAAKLFPILPIQIFFLFVGHVGRGEAPPGNVLAGPARNQGGRIHAGAGSGVSRLLEYERLHGEGK